jgi:hypothetical protein
MVTLIYCVDVELWKYSWQLCISEITLLQRASRAGICPCWREMTSPMQSIQAKVPQSLTMDNVTLSAAAMVA